jgi:16S rRNA (uracil1498-N3)-methyltransferase
VPQILPVKSLQAWLQSQPPKTAQARWLLSLCEGSGPLTQHLSHGTAARTTFLSGPEGGLSAAEETAAAACGFTPVTLGPRVLRAETAALAALVRLLV